MQAYLTPSPVSSSSLDVSLVLKFHLLDARVVAEAQLQFSEYSWHHMANSLHFSIEASPDVL